MPTRLTYSDRDGAWEQVEAQYSAEKFAFPVCELVLTDWEEIDCTGLDVDNSETEERKLSYEDDYGND
ncbi:hypothetical protein ACLJYM_24800 [Rhizobium giardinii]|uniref:hypothetical protein n=1 Tax=Rhizobium giardinii TaxID=56731 RepID=UPI0039E12197